MPLAIAAFLDPNPHTGETMSASTLPLMFGATIVVTGAVIAWWLAIIGRRHKLVTGALIALGVGAMGFAAAFITSGATLAGGKHSVGSSANRYSRSENRTSHYREPHPTGSRLSC